MLLARLFRLVLGTAFLVFGLSCALWLATLAVDANAAAGLLLWMAENSPLPLSVTGEELVHDAMQNHVPIATGVSAAFFAWIGFSLVSDAFAPRRPADESYDRRYRIELKETSPRVGRPLEGRLRLLKDAGPGQRYQLRLACGRANRLGDADRPVYVHVEQVVLPATQDAEGWCVPFRFDIPVTAPPSDEDPMGLGAGFGWSLRLARDDTWFSTVTYLPLTIGPASG